MHISLIHKTQKDWFYNTIYTETNNGVLGTLFCFYSPRGLFKQTLYIKLCGNTQTFCAFHIARITFRFRTVHHFFVKAVTTATISLHIEKKIQFSSFHLQSGKSRVKKNNNLKLSHLFPI